MLENYLKINIINKKAIIYLNIKYIYSIILASSVYILFIRFIINTSILA